MYRLSILLCSMILVLSSNTNACTDFRITAKDRTVVVGRTMEFPTDLRSKIWIIPRGIQTTSISDEGIKGLSWTNKYAFMALDGLNMDTNYVEGMNEAGLSAEGLMFTEAKYQKATSGSFITYAELIGWILGNFNSVEEVKKELPKIKVIDKYLKPLKGNLGLHFSVYDVNGNAMVIEFINGEQKIYDNPVGVMTNRPEFSWQLQNLSNYINLYAPDKTPRKMGKFTIEPTGVGSGLLGLPGDWTPPSRFVRVAYALDASLKPKNAEDAVNLAEHIMNIVDIPKGDIKEKVAKIMTLYGHAQWAVIKDLTNKVMYLRTYDNLTLRKIDMKQFKLTHGSAKKSIEVSRTEPWFIDISNSFH